MKKSETSFPTHTRTHALLAARRSAALAQPLLVLVCFTSLSLSSCKFKMLLENTMHPAEYKRMCVEMSRGRRRKPPPDDCSSQPSLLLPPTLTSHHHLLSFSTKSRDSSSYLNMIISTTFIQPWKDFEETVRHNAPLLAWSDLSFNKGIIQTLFWLFSLVTGCFNTRITRNSFPLGLVV